MRLRGEGLMGSREKFPEELNGQGHGFLLLARDHMVLAIDDDQLRPAGHGP